MIDTATSVLVILLFPVFFFSPNWSFYYSLHYRLSIFTWENFFSSRTLLQYSYVIHVLTWFHKKLKEIKNLLTCLKKNCKFDIFVWGIQSNRFVLNRNKRTAKFLFMLVCAEIFCFYWTSSRRTECIILVCFVWIVDFFLRHKKIVVKFILEILNI
jgi:hypothetical protein